ncbi:protein phosphatase 1 regulatory subunit 32-like [Ylistrum balloti]|uniref:protein phosphatase 1 regulatory subunit 32-like n=1 Tax=Ylistrum balloti TaxID=509963 RepID=UPI00290590E0|nr:protein phosphatase 1 regulatory subunit 32-like [Ylistrum balloti]
MGPLPTGTRTLHMKESHGSDINMMKFYNTTNSTSYGRYWEAFKPRPGRHTGTGYLSNFRPAVYYSKKLDDVDNPVLSDICSRNYHSLTELHFQPYKENSGKEALPANVHQVGSGFVRQKPVTTPIEKEVNGVFIDTRAATAPTNILPKSVPLLHKLRSKDPVELENCGYGPKYMLSETKQRFVGDQPDRMDVSTKTTGPKEESGFTHAYNVEPITFIPGSSHQNDNPGWDTVRPTGSSIMKTHFLRSEYPHGDEVLPRLAVGSERGTGFTREKAKPLYVQRVMGDAYDKAGNIPNLRLERTKKADPTEYLNMQNPNNYSSITMKTFQGKQRPDNTEADRLDNTSTGKQELSGYSENNDRFVATADEPRRFITHYLTRFGPDPNPQGIDRAGHTRGGVQQQKPDGFTKSTAVHAYGNDLDTTATLRRLEPYVARSIKARDVFYDDHLHDAKSYQLQASA